ALPGSFCEGDSTVLTASSGQSYLWSTNETTQSIVVSIQGSYFVTVTDSNGCDATSATVPVTVNQLPIVSFTGMPDSVCLNDPSITLTGNPSGGTFSGAGISGNVFTPVVAGAGSHIVSYSFE